MRCSACGHDNRAAAKFCDECGGRLGGETPAPAAPRPYTPRHLAERILTSRAALVGERKPVTVLFADVQGSMALAEQVDAEEWHAMMNRFLTLLADGVHRFEGTVNQYTGDGIMALFGAPTALEDHAVRACLAALEIQTETRRLAAEVERSGVDLQLRVGLNSGQVIAGDIGAGPLGYTAIGAQVGMAQRMESIAPPGGVMVSESTARLVEGAALLGESERVHVKGAADAVLARRLLSAGPQHWHAGPTHSTLVGREWELARGVSATTLRACWTASTPPPYAAGAR